MLCVSTKLQQIESSEARLPLSYLSWNNPTCRNPPHPFGACTLPRDQLDPRRR